MAANVWKQLRVDMMGYLSEVRHPALSHEQQSRLAMAWPTAYLSGNGAGASEDFWRGALGYSVAAWPDARDAFRVVLQRDGDLWGLSFLSSEVERQREESKRQSERVSKRWNTAVSSGKPRNTSEYPASALESKEEEPTDRGGIGGRLRLVAKDGTEWAPASGQVRDWRLAHPGLDLGAEFAKMRGWLAANPERGKTARGMARFANGWLQRARPEVVPAASDAVDAGVWGLTPRRGGER